MKRFALILLALMMALACLHAAAEDQRIDAAPGELIEVELVLTANPDKAIGVDTVLEYDHSVFEFVPTEKIRNDKPTLGLIYGGIPEGSTLRPKFRVKQDAAYGQYIIAIRVQQAINTQETEVTSMVFSSCLVNVREKKVEQTTEAKVKAAKVTVHFVNEAGEMIIPDYAYTFDEGPHVVYAMPLERYQLIDNDRVDVLIDADGAHPSEVTFHYKKVKITGMVIFHYVDEKGESIFPDLPCKYDEGQHTAYAMEMENYVLLDEEEALVTVDANGAHPSEVTFHYASLYTPTPTPKPTPTPTRKPTPTPTRKPTPTPTRKPTPTPTRKPTPTPTRKPTPTPTRKPTPTPTRKPTPTPTPKPTPTPTRKPTPTPTPKPTPTPTRKPTPTPTPKPTPTPTPIKKLELFKKVGNYVTFGTYPQTESGTDKTPIEWLVLDYDAKNNKALLLSRYGLDAKPYNTKYTNITWANCTLRTWLNKDFMNKAFSSTEQKAILTTAVDNSMRQGFFIVNGGSNTHDKIFLLSCSEAEKYLGVTYFTDNLESRVEPTAYAIRQGAFTSFVETSADGKAVGVWWLRSPGSSHKFAACVMDDGSLRRYSVSNGTFSVRPALWINLDSDIF